MAVELLAHVLALRRRAAHAELLEEASAIVGGEAMEIELMEGGAEEAVEIGKDEAAREHGEAPVIALAEGGEQLAQIAVEEAAIAGVVGPLLEHLQSVQHEHERMRPQHGQCGGDELRVVTRLGCAERLACPFEESLEKFTGIAVLIEAPREQPGKRAAPPAGSFLEPMADERGLARTAHGRDAEGAHRGIAHPAIEPGDLIVASREFLVVAGLVDPLGGKVRRGRCWRREGRHCERAPGRATALREVSQEDLKPAFGVPLLGLALVDGMVGKKLDELPPKRIHRRRSPGTHEGDGLAGLQDGDQRLEHRAVTGNGKDVVDGTTHRFCMA